MGEVVDDGDAVRGPDHLHAATDAGEGLQRGDGLVQRHADGADGAEGGQGIGDIVCAGDVEDDRMLRAAELRQGEPHTGRHRLEVVGVEGGRLLAQGEGDDLVAREGLGQRLGLEIVEVEHGPGRPPGEAAEQVAQLLHRLVVQRDVGDHGDRRIVARDGAIGLIDLGDEQVRAADQGAGERVIGIGEILHHRAVHDGRRAARLVQDPGDHAGDGRLAAGAGHADRGGRGVEQL